VTSDPACLPLEDHLCFAVYAANHAFAAAYKPLLEPLGVTYPQYLVLLILWEQQGRTVKEIGARLHLDSGTLTPLLKRMEAAGLVRRQRDAKDERQVRIQLTPKGAVLQSHAAELKSTLFCALGEAEEAITKLRNSLTAVSGRLRSTRAGD
jgi:DNA-binding MarR family transcriptional regulator